MTPERWQQVERLYHAARDEAPEARAAFLAEACGGDAALRRDVESLLGYALGAGRFRRRRPSSHSGSSCRRTAPGTTRRRLRRQGARGCRWDGRGVPRARRAAGPRCRDQDIAARVQARPEPHRPLRARGAGPRMVAAMSNNCWGSIRSTGWWGGRRTNGRSLTARWRATCRRFWRFAMVNPVASWDWDRPGWSIVP